MKEVITLLDDFTIEQKKAITNFKKACTRLRKSGLYIHNCYGQISVYQEGTITDINNDFPDDGNNLKCYEVGEYIVFNFPSESTDDTHYIHLTEKGKKIMSQEDGNGVREA